MKRFILSGAVIVVFGIYVVTTMLSSNTVQQNQVPVLSDTPPTPTQEPVIQTQVSSPDTTNVPSQAVTSPTQDTTQTQTQTSEAVTTPRPVPRKAPVPVSPPTPTPVITPPPARKSGYNDGSYTGDSADAFYGYVQVKAIIKGGKLVDVQFLDWPQDRGHSIDINGYAKPGLVSEAIQAQSANVDIVSGATATSEAFIQSLDSALSQAKI